MSVQLPGRQRPKPASTMMGIRNRIIQGLFVAAPIVITFAIILWLYSVLRTYLIDPVAHVLVRFYPGYAEDELPAWIDQFAAPLLALVIVLLLLWFLGSVLHTRLHQLLRSLMLRVPVVTTVYAAVSKVFDTLQQQQDQPRFKRVVLIGFPHPGMRVPAFVTSSCVDVATGQTILCVYVPTTPVPTSGYMLLVPEEEVTELDWDLNDTLQAIISGGISVPSRVDYYGAGGSPPPPEAGPLPEAGPPAHGAGPPPASPLE